MNSRISVSLSFDTHDDLVLAYSQMLSEGHAWVKVPSHVSAGAELFVELRVRDATVTLSAVVQGGSHGSPGDDGMITLVRFEGSDWQSQLADFILAVDSSAQPDASRTERRVLTLVVVDDQEVHRANAARPFLQRGDMVYLGENGLEGLALAIKHQPDAVLSDVQMPRADGWQLLRMLRSRKGLRRTPVIFLTTLSKEADRLKGYRLGVDDYLAKPFSPDILVARVERAVQRVKVGAYSIAPVANDALRGDLEQVSLPALLSFLELERKSGVIHLDQPGSSIALREGRPVRATTGVLDSKDCKHRALFELLDLRRGRFEFVPGDVEETDSIRSSVGALLLEHARIADEAGH